MSHKRQQLQAWIDAAPIPRGDHWDGHGSEIERQLAYRLSKYRHSGRGPLLPLPSTRLAAQAPLHTSATTFYGDLVMMREDRIVLIECDGAAYHRNTFKDDLRVALILAAGLVDDIFRFSGTMLTHGPEDAVYLMQQTLPGNFFEDATPIILSSLVHSETKAAGTQLAQAGVPFTLKYDAQVETSGYDEDDAPRRRPSEFQFTYMTAAAPTPRIAAMTAALVTTQPHTTDRAFYVVERALEQAGLA